MIKVLLMLFVINCSEKYDVTCSEQCLNYGIQCMKSELNAMADNDVDDMEMDKVDWIYKHCSDEFRAMKSICGGKYRANK